MRMQGVKRQILRYLRNNQRLDPLDIAAAFSARNMPEQKMIYEAGRLLEEAKYVTSSCSFVEGERWYRITEEGIRQSLSESRKRRATVIALITITIAVLSFFQ